MKKTITRNFTARFRNIIILSGKGGVHKTGLATLLTSAALLMNSTRLRLFEVDKQTLLSDLFPDHCTNIHLSSAAELSARSMSDIEKLDGLFQAFVDENSDLVICDIGSGYESHVFEAMVRSGLPRVLGSSGKETAIIIPLNTTEESVDAAVRASRMGTIALPDAVQIFCVDTEEYRPNNAKSQKTWDEHIANHVASNGLMVFPSLPPDIYDLFTSSRLAPHVFAELDAADLARNMGKKYFVANSAIVQMKALREHVKREAERLLGFRQSEPAQQ